MRRRGRPAANPETVAALKVLDRYKHQLEALRDAGDPYARWRLHVLRHARRSIVQYGMTGLARLRLEGYEREVARLAGD